MPSNSVEQGYKGAGECQIAIKRPTGKMGGFVALGNASILEVTPESDQQTRVSYKEESYGQALDTDNTAKPTKIKIEGDSITADNLAKALCAALERNVSVAAGDVIDEPHTAWHNEQIRLKHQYITNVVISVPSSGTGTNYTTDAVGYAVGEKVITLITGIGTILAGGAVVFDGDTTKYAVESFADGVLVLVNGLKKAIPASATDVTVQAAITSLTAGTDYNQDSLYTDFIEFLPDGAVADGQNVLVDYSHKAITKDVLLGGLSSFDAIVILNGINRRSSKRHRFYAGNVTVTSNGGFNFLTQDFPKYTLDAVANIDQDPESPSYGRPFIVDYNVTVTG